MMPAINRESTHLERHSTAVRVAALLRSRISDGRFAPGERLNELALAAELGVSRSPIREAIAQLTAEGLVRAVPYKGAFVTELSKTRLQDLLDFRLALEQFAVRRATERAKPEQLDRVEEMIAAIAAQAKRGKFSAAVDADLVVHEYLVELAESPLLAQTYKAMLGELRRYIAQTSRHYKSLQDLAVEHTALLAAMRAGKVREAASLIASHITHGFDHASKEKD